MRIWVKSRTDWMPVFCMAAEDKDDSTMLSAIKQQLDTARVQSNAEGLTSSEGESCKCEHGEFGIEHIEFPVLLGQVVTVYRMDSTPPMEDRSQVRLITKRHSDGGRRFH